MAETWEESRVGSRHCCVRAWAWRWSWRWVSQSCFVEDGGARIALTAPLAVVFLAWYATEGRTSTVSPSIAQAAGFSRSAVANAFGQLGRVTGIGQVLAVILVIGTVSLVVETPWSELRITCAATAGLLVGAIAFVSSTAYGRAGLVFPNIDQARATRYVYVIAALVLPAIAVAASALARRWKPFACVVIVLLLIGLPGNVRAFHPSGLARYTLGVPSQILSLTEVPEAGHVRRGLQPFPLGAPGLTIGWLLDAKRDGRLPDPGPLTPGDRASAALALSLDQRPGGAASAGSCRPIPPGTTIEVRKDQHILLPDGFTEVFSVLRGQLRASQSYAASLGHDLRVVSGPIRLAFLPPSSRSRLELCG